MPEPSFRLTAPVFRAHNPFWSRDPASGEGARRHGGRFNRRGVPALYTAATPLGVLLEASPGGRPLQPITLCEYRVDCADVVDATDPELRGALEIEDDDLACPDWRATMLAGSIPRLQALADRLVALGFAALRVPSFAPRAPADGVDVVFWRWEGASASRPCRGRRQPAAARPLQRHVKRGDGRRRYPPATPSTGT